MSAFGDLVVVVGDVSFRCTHDDCDGRGGFTSGDPRLYKFLPKSIQNLMPYWNTGKGGISRETQDLCELMTRWANASVASRLNTSLKRSAHARQAAAATSAYTECAEMESARSGSSLAEVLATSNGGNLGIVGDPVHGDAPLTPTGQFSPRALAAESRPALGFKSAIRPIGPFAAQTIGDFSGSGFMGFDRQPPFFQGTTMDAFFRNENWVYDELNAAAAGKDLTVDWTYAHAKKCIGAAAVGSTEPRQGPFKATLTGMNQRTGKFVIVVGVTSEKFEEVRGTFNELLVERPARLEQWDRVLRSNNMVPIYDVRGQRTSDITVDKCCQFRKKLQELAANPDLGVWLDGGHYIARYNHAKPDSHPSAARVPALIALAVLQPDPTRLAVTQAIWASSHQVSPLSPPSRHTHTHTSSV